MSGPRGVCKTVCRYSGTVQVKGKSRSRCPGIDGNAIRNSGNKMPVGPDGTATSDSGSDMTVGADGRATQ